VASENYSSKAVRKALGSRLTDKYSEGYPGARYYPGNNFYDEIERLAQQRALKLFGLLPGRWQVNVQPYSGSPANLAIYAALMKPGEVLMGMSLSSGGHLTHGHKVSLSGKLWKAVQYQVNQKTGLIDYKRLEDLARKARPKIIVSGFSAYPRKIDFKKFGRIAKKVGAYHLADISHIAGLIAAGIHPSPFDAADVVMTTTHKTLRGPRGAVIFSRKSQIPDAKLTIAEAIDRAVFPGLQGGPHHNVTAAKAVCFSEAASPRFKSYARQIVKNAKILAAELKALSFKLLTDGTDNHLILVDIKRSLGINGLEAEKRLEAAGILANRNSIPGDASPFKPSGLRLGTPALATRGMKESQMKQVAQLIYNVLAKKQSLAEIKKSVQVLCQRFPI
jgi:glycine hydroxymethyltransferase